MLTRWLLLFCLVLILVKSIPLGSAATPIGAIATDVDGRTKPGADSIDTVVICPKAWHSTLSRWVDYRKTQGHRILVLEPSVDAASTQTKLHQITRTRPVKFVWLIGNTQSPLGVATHLRPAKVNVLFGSTPEIATDLPYADLDGDDLPDLAIGRLPIDSEPQLDEYINRVMAYENTFDRGLWRRRINFIAGVGGFDPLIDKSIEQLSRRLISQMIPNGYETSMTFGSWSSPYCPAPHRFQEVTLDRFNEGCLFWVYIGHGNEESLDHIYTPTNRHLVMDTNSLKQLKAQGKNPIAIFLACNTGAFDRQAGCLAGGMVSEPGGAIAAIASTRVTMPYAMSLMSMEMMQEQFYGKTKTLGELVQLAKRQMADPTSDRPTANFRKLIDESAQILSPRPDLLADEIREHLLLFHLLGDPLLRLQHPATIPMETVADAQAGQPLTIRGEVPHSGRLVVEVCYERSRFRIRPLTRLNYNEQPDLMQRFQDDYEQSRQLTCTQKQMDVPAGPFELSVEIPGNANGVAHVRAYWENAQVHALGALDLEIQKRRP